MTMRCLFCKSFTQNNRACKRCTAFNFNPRTPPKPNVIAGWEPVITTTTVSPAQVAIRTETVIT